jgi:hypothetical protein
MNVFVTGVLADVHQYLKPFYSDIGRPSVDPELMIRMLIVGYCYGIRHERRLCEEVKLHLAYRWFCKLDLDNRVPHHSTFSINRLVTAEFFDSIDPSRTSVVEEAASSLGANIDTGTRGWCVSGLRPYRQEPPIVHRPVICDDEWR